MSNAEVRTRFAPSPTGDLHVGSARSALFAYLWAKKNGGKFVLRIEDTDQERTVEGSLDSILEGLRWIGTEWDEGPEVSGEFGPYFQSKRLDIYQKHLTDLVSSGKAYPCFCTKERLDEMRAKQQENKEAPRYDQTCRILTAEQIKEKQTAGLEQIIRLAVPEEGTVKVLDVLRGEVEFDVKDIDDQVLMKADGFPTYHLANVVDDHLMKITHVIRGEEWLPSTPKHVLLYQAFGWEVPIFVHLSLFLSSKGGKMSKRHGDTSLLAFRDKGYLAEALVNFVALLGWNPKTEEEFFSLDELIKRFDLKMINKANPVFETEKLDWMGMHYMKQLAPEDILQRINDLIGLMSDNQAYVDFRDWIDQYEDNVKSSIISGLSERAHTLLELTEATQWTEDMADYQAEDLVWKKSDKETTINILDKLVEQIEEITAENFVAAELEKTLINWIESSEWGNGDVLWPMRYALCGQKKSPSPFELAEMLQKDSVLTRLKSARIKLSEI